MIVKIDYYVYRSRSHHLSLTSSLLIIDGHVHIYDCFDISIFLNSALKNFEKEAKRWTSESIIVPVLLLTEGKNQNWFFKLKTTYGNGEYIAKDASNRWMVVSTEEDTSILLKNAHGMKIVLVSGRQIITAEKLEVLGIATHSDFKDGLPLSDIYSDVIESGGIPVIAWGVGKWIGRRGKIINNFLKSNRGKKIFIGDNSGRPYFLVLTTQY